MGYEYPRLMYFDKTPLDHWKIIRYIGLCPKIFARIFKENFKRRSKARLLKLIENWLFP